jgi:hypothetical protein
MGSYLDDQVKKIELRKRAEKAEARVAELESLDEQSTRVIVSLKAEVRGLKTMLRDMQTAFEVGASLEEIRKRFALTDEPSPSASNSQEMSSASVPNPTNLDRQGAALGRDNVGEVVDSPDVRPDDGREEHPEGVRRLNSRGEKQSAFQRMVQQVEAAYPNGDMPSILAVPGYEQRPNEAKREHRFVFESPNCTGCGTHSSRAIGECPGPRTDYPRPEESIALLSQAHNVLSRYEDSDSRVAGLLADIEAALRSKPRSETPISERLKTEALRLLGVVHDRLYGERFRSIAAARSYEDIKSVMALLEALPLPTGSEDPR